MYDEVKAFGAALDAAEERFEEAGKAIQERHSLAYTECPGCVAEEPIYAARSAAKKAAWDTLEESADPLVRWIAHYFRDYRSEARTVLEALPASMAELDQIASDKGWCDDWERARRTARAAGVLPVEIMTEASGR